MYSFIKIARGITSNRKLLFKVSANITNTINRRFQNSRKLLIKMYMETENKYAYEIMESNGYAASLKITKNLNNCLPKEEFDQMLSADWSRRSTKELLNAFDVFAKYCTDNSHSIADKMFDDYIDCLTDSIKFTSDEELETIFYSLAKWPETQSIRTRNYIEIWAALDDECLKRLKEWSFGNILHFMSLFYLLNVNKASDFCYKSLQRLATKSNRLSSNELVKTAFFVGIMRKSPDDMHYLEVAIENCFNSLTIDELAIISMGFFKSKTPLRSQELISKFIDKIVQNSSSIHEISLAALLKILRYSTKFTSHSKIYYLLDCLQHEVTRLSIMCCVHLVLLGTTSLTVHKSCLDIVAEHVVKHIEQARLKDLERIILSYGIYTYKPQLSSGCLFESVMNQLRSPLRATEIETHWRTFTCSVSFLTLLGLYPADLIDKALNPEMMRNTYGKSIMGCGREILYLENISDIFCKDTVKNRLSRKDIKYLSKKLTDYIPTDDYKGEKNVNEKMFIELVNILKEIRGGDEYVCTHHILTHHQRGDIIVCNHKTGTPLSVKEYPKTFGEIHRPPDENSWIVFVIVGRNGCLNQSDNEPYGHFVAKKRELEALGYQVRFVCYDEWIKLENNQMKKEHLISLLSSFQ